MTTQTLNEHAVDTIQIRTLERPWCTEYYLTAAVDDPTASVDTVQTRYGEIAGLVASRDIQPIAEKIYGRADAREEVLAARGVQLLRHGLDPGLPVTFIEGRPASGAIFGGVQLWGITAKSPDVTEVRSLPSPGLPSARLWTGPGFRMLYQPSVLGRQPNGIMPDCPSGQARRMLANASAALASHGFRFPQVIRTWIYLARLLDWYGEFNHVRTAHYAREGLGGDSDHAVFPASTGIQGTPGGAECCMDLLALDGDATGRVVARPILGSRRQPPAFSYGSAFSRGMTLEMDGRSIVYVSGTASIDRDGRSIHVGDAEAQAFETLLNIAALLEEQGGSLESICMATLFCKNQPAYDAYRHVTQLLRAPSLPTIPIQADVCRSDLLLEIEAVALI